MYPSIPNAIFDISSWFQVAFPKPEFNWYAKNDTYHEDLKVWKHNEEQYLQNTYTNEYQIKISDEGELIINFLHLETPIETDEWFYKDFIRIIR